MQATGACQPCLGARLARASMVALLIALAGTTLLAPALAQVQRVPLRCRLAEGPWRPCVMTVEAVGERWKLRVDNTQLSFRHDGKGVVEMQRPAGIWKVVNARWNEDQALCWDGICAQGDIPLD